MSKKKIISSIILTIILVLIGFIQINIINTKALSPMGTTENNYKVVSKEFGKDFTEFIKDNSPIKIYTEEEIVVSINSDNYKITTNNSIVKFTKGLLNNISKGGNYLKNKVDSFIDYLNNNQNTTKPSEDLDLLIEGYIQKSNQNDPNNSEQVEDTIDVSGN